MPPDPLWLTGGPAIGQFLRERHRDRGGPWCFVATRANGQPAYAYYFADGDEWVRMGLLVVTVRADRISSIIRFRDSPWLSEFGVPERFSD
jgi:RNA polymerase sigma-70 factor (ECF subfamily)